MKAMQIEGKRPVVKYKVLARLILLGWKKD